MRFFLSTLIIALAVASAAAQNGNGHHKKPEFELEAERLQGSFSGGKLQYNWSLPKVRLRGGGFFERTSGEAPFTANVVLFEPLKHYVWLSVRTEAVAELGNSASFQIGGQINLDKLFPLKRVGLESLAVAQMPGLLGKRPPHTFVRAESGEKQLLGGLLPSVRAEGFYVINPGKPDHSEFRVWLGDVGIATRYDDGRFGIAAVYRWKVF